MSGVREPGRIGLGGYSDSGDLFRIAESERHSLLSGAHFRQVDGDKHRYRYGYYGDNTLDENESGNRVSVPFEDSVKFADPAVSSVERRPSRGAIEVQTRGYAVVYPAPDHPGPLAVVRVEEELQRARRRPRAPVLVCGDKLNGNDQRSFLGYGVLTFVHKPDDVGKVDWAARIVRHRDAFLLIVPEYRVTSIMHCIYFLPNCLFPSIVGSNTNNRTLTVANQWRIT